MILATTQMITLTIWDGTIENVMLNLEKLSKNTFQWFYLNQVKGNPDKYHLILSNGKKIRMNVQDLNTINSKSENLLGITIVILVFSLTFTIF